MKNLRLVALVLLSLPILLHVYNPSMHLGAFGLLLGVIGMTASPLILFWVLFAYVAKEWKK